MKQNKSSLLGTFWLWLFLLAFSVPVRAGLITCGDQINLSPGANCIATIDTSFAITTSDCPGSYWLIAKELDGDTIAWGVNVVSFDVSNYLGTDIIIQIKNIPSGTECESTYEVYDGANPIINCPRDTVSCTASLHPDSLKAISVSDNCGIDTAYFQDPPWVLNCNFMPAAFINRLDRQWTVEDVYGNSATCIQQIFIRRADTSMVDMPDDITIDCAENPDTSITGRPTINGHPINNDGPCNLTVTFTDTELETNCGQPLILRRWVVSNDCIISQVKIDTQLIVLDDITPPVIDCADSLFYQTDLGVCNADIVLDAPTVTDNCSDFYVETTIPGLPLSTNYTFQNVPKGMHLVTFVATDSCGNISAPCTSKLFVIDNETPVAACKDITVVSLPSNGNVAVQASVFNAGSTDNCSPLVFTGRRDGGNFAPTVPFSCADAGDTLMVTVKVAELLNPNSFTTCMVQVIVQDKIPPGMSCPNNQTIQCTANYSNLAVFGTPFVFDACGFTLTVDSTINIQNCGTGTITRTFTATDPSGNVNFCSQTINVINSTPYNGQGIVWPLDTMLVNYCAGPANLGPINLPAPYNFPQTPTSSCAMLAVNYLDQVFDISSPACYKIVRTWKVIDWCQYNPANPTVGSWSHQQIIAVVDNIPPVITLCPSDTTVSLGIDCNLASAVFFPVSAIDCSPELTFTNNSPYAASGNDPSGMYPPGVYNIAVKVEDGCGNKSTCSFKLTVKDLKKPTPKCSTGIITELQAMGGQVMGSVQAELFDEGSFDNCTDQGDLEFSIRLLGDNTPPTPGLVFDCEDVGEYFVEVWVTDELGNADYCVTSVFVQDNMDLCPFEDDTLVVNGLSIEGIVESMMGDEMPEVEVQAANTGMMDETNDFGEFTINGLQQGANYTIAPKKENGILNGVTSYDLALITSHILGNLPITSPYKLIAADVNRSGVITTSDVLELRKLILHLRDDFTNNTSWRFVPKDYVFPNPANPFSPPYPEAVNLTGINGQLPSADFIGIKIGDVNGNANPGFVGSETSDRNGSVINLITVDRMIEAGEEVTVPIKMTTASDLLALQFTIEFETDDLELRGHEKGALPTMGEESFGKGMLDKGVLTTVWFNTSSVVVGKDDALFSLRFVAKKQGRLSEMLSLTGRYTEAMVYRAAGQSYTPVLEFLNPTSSNPSASFQLFQNQPNPFKQETKIGFSLPERSEATLTIYDADGRILKAVHGLFEKGFNEVAVERAELQSSGVVFYKLETTTHTAVRKMIIM